MMYSAIVWTVDLPRFAGNGQGVIHHRIVVRQEALSVLLYKLLTLNSENTKYAV